MSVGRKTVVTGTMAISLALATSFIGPWEGKRNDPYRDIAGIPTVCYGETRVKMRSYSDKECEEMLKESVKGFQEEVLKCTPILVDKPYQLAAATSLAYNIGTAAYCNSTVAQQFNRGNYQQACEAFLMWDKITIVGKKVVIKGLATRRKEEKKLCLQNLPR